MIAIAIASRELFFKVSITFDHRSMTNLRYYVFVIQLRDLSEIRLTFRKVAWNVRSGKSLRFRVTATVFEMASDVTRSSLHSVQLYQLWIFRENKHQNKNEKSKDNNENHENDVNSKNHHNSYNETAKTNHNCNDKMSACRNDQRKGIVEIIEQNRNPAAARMRSLPGTIHLDSLRMRTLAAPWSAVTT
jgi:ABC-type nickel/cobalt efflux system permease component RcnA